MLNVVTWIADLALRARLEPWTGLSEGSVEGQGEETRGGGQRLDLGREKQSLHQTQAFDCQRKKPHPWGICKPAFKLGNDERNEVLHGRRGMETRIEAGQAPVKAGIPAPVTGWVDACALLAARTGAAVA